MNVHTGLTLTALYEGKVNQFHISYSPFGRWEVEYESGYDLEYCDSFNTCKKLNKWIREFEQYKVTRRTKEDFPFIAFDGQNGWYCNKHYPFIVKPAVTMEHPEYINVIFNCYYLGDNKYQLIDENGDPLYFESLDEFKRFLRKYDCYIAGNTEELHNRKKMFCGEIF